jgi:type II secretory pathway pseudopilin PulG
MWPSLVERHRRLREQSDRGFTMLEMVVGMTLMMIFLSIFTTAIISMFDSTNKSQAVNNGSAQLNIAFGRLDRTIRYASFVSQQSVGGDGNWYVTFQTTNTGTPVCTQLRIDKTAQRLQQRTWNVSGTAPNTTASGLTGWTQLASGITNGGAAVGSPDQPFTLTPAGSAVTSESLNLHLLALDGSGRTATTSLSTVTFVAINTNLKTPDPTDPTTHVCNEVAIT